MELATKRLVTAYNELSNSRDLEQQILADALKREARAKAAIKAVLGCTGVSDAEVARVIAEIDNTQEGDIR